MGVCGGVGVHTGTLGLNWTLWPPVFFDWWGGPIGLTCCRSWMGKRGRFGGRSLGLTFFFTYLDNNWSKSGLDFTNRPAALNVLVFHLPIFGHRGLKVCGRRGSLALSDRPLEHFRPSGNVTDHLHLGTGPSVMRSMGSRAYPFVCAWPPGPEFVMVTFSVSPPSGVFSATTFLQEILLFPSASRELPMMTSLSLPLSAVLGWIRTLLPLKSTIFIGKGSVSS
jgi:hypothetical protein